MKSLYLRIYATVVVVLLLFALVSGWIVERHLDEERTRNEQVASDRLGAWAELLGNSLPAADTPVEVQARRPARLVAAPARAARARRLRRASASALPNRSSGACSTASEPFSFKLDDGRTLWTMRPGLRQGGGRRGGPRAARRAGPAAKSAAAGGRRRRGRCCGPGCRAVPGWRSSWSSSSRRRRRRLPGGAPADAAPRGAEARRRAVRRGRARPSGRDLGRRRGRRGRGELQRRGGAGRGAGPLAPLAARQRQPRAALAAGAHEDGGVDARRGDAGPARHA